MASDPPSKAGTCFAWLRWCCCCGCCGWGVCLGILVLVVASVVGLLFAAQGQVYDLYSPLPSPDDLASVGATHWTRPSDGGTLEYFAVNKGHGRAAIVGFHGSGGSGYGVCEWDDFEPILKAADTQLLCVSIPGFGTSSPWLAGDAMNATAALAYLAADSLALARSLGAPKVAAFGLSYGLEYAVSLTDLVSRSDGVELGGLASVVGGPWCRSDNPVCFGSAEGMARVLQDLFTVDLLLPATMIYLFRPMVTAASEGIIEQMLPAEDYAAMAASHPRAARILDVDYPRGMMHYVSGMVDATRFFANPANANEDLAPYEAAAAATTAAGAPLEIFVVDHDENVPAASQAWLVSHLPGATVHRMPGMHLQAPVREAVAALVAHREDI